jgi:NOL1/NOP2/fmu family ribosome biogenesis protein
VRLWPHHLNGEGHFIAILCKTDHTGHTAPSPKPFSLHRPDREATQHFTTFWEHSMTSPAPERLHQSGTYLYQLPPGLPELDNLKQLHPGWWLGSIKIGRFEPSHALALGVQSNQVQRSCDLAADDPQLLAYLRGSSLPIPGEAGWVLITVAGYPLGWGKRSAGLIKNLYPRGLRWQD